MYVTTLSGTPCACRGQRPSAWKNFSRTAKPSRVAPVLLPRNSLSVGSRLHCAANSSVDQSCFIEVRPSFSFLEWRIAGWERAVYHFADWLKGEVNAVEKVLFHAKAGAKADSFPIRKQKDEI